MCKSTSKEIYTIFFRLIVHSSYVSYSYDQNLYKSNLVKYLSMELSNKYEKRLRIMSSFLSASNSVLVLLLQYNQLQYYPQRDNDKLVTLKINSFAAPFSFTKRRREIAYRQALIYILYRFSETSIKLCNKLMSSIKSFLPVQSPHSTRELFIHVVYCRDNTTDLDNILQ